MSTFATSLLMRQLKELTENPPSGISVGLKNDCDLFNWEVIVEGPPGSYYEGGLFRAELSFPSDFPNNPPVMKFLSRMWHPNIYEDGSVCISILHSPGVDMFNEFESREERWRPILSVEAILISVQNMLSEPNENSPANIDAAKQYREDKQQFKKRVRRTVQDSLEDS
ncbi:hypothetical protein WA556_003974, partial [Blastocystis sp. ATCC 50177/Nand II]